MERDEMLNEILAAVKLYLEHIDKRFDELDKKLDERFDKVDSRLDRMEKKQDGSRIEVTEA